MPDHPTLTVVTPEGQEVPLANVYYGKRQRFLTFTELRSRPMPEPIIEGVLYSNQETVIFGPQGGGKTAIAMDMALSSIYAMDWHGRKTTMGRFVLVCGEGGGKVLANRIEAWLQYHGITNTETVDELLLITEFPVHMLDAESVDEFLELVGYQTNVTAIIVDTLSANFGGGDENSVRDMGVFLDAIRHIRLRTKAGLVVIHHTGHHDQTRPQGSNKIRRDVDVELLVNRDARDDTLFGIVGGGTLKSRNGEPLDMVPFRLEQVTLPERDRHGNHLTSIVCVPTDEAPNFDTTTVQKSRRGRNQIAVLRALKAWAAAKGYAEGEKVLVPTPEWQEVYTAAGLNRKQAYKVKESLTEAGVFTFSVGGFTWEPEQ
jgi:hypothetical protein